MRVSPVKKTGKSKKSNDKKRKSKGNKDLVEALPLIAPGPSRQLQFYQLLVSARKQWFMDALSEILKESDQNKVKEQVIKYVPAEAQKLLAAAGIRDEHVFPLPTIIDAKPSLVGYYRLLLGVPQKGFYKKSTGMGAVESMEKNNTASEKQKARIPEFCEAMAKPLAELVKQIPNITKQDISELPLLTYGAQLQGSNNTAIGKRAMEGIFSSISEVVNKHIKQKQGVKLTIENSAGRTVIIRLASDPDVAIDEQVGSTIHKKLAIEVKGGTDVSNAHNRAGEAEKSHIKAKGRGYPEFWTIISKTGVDPTKLSGGSKTTNHWFDVAEILARKGKDWDDFRERLAGTVGIPLLE
jgi:hypothetical protein